MKGGRWVEKNGDKWRVRTRDFDGSKRTVGTFATESEALIAASDQVIADDGTPYFTVKMPDYAKVTRKSTPTVSDFWNSLIDAPSQPQACIHRSL